MRIEKSNYADIITNTHTSVYENRTVINQSVLANEHMATDARTQALGYRRMQRDTRSRPTSTAVFTLIIIWSGDWYRSQ